MSALEPITVGDVAAPGEKDRWRSLTLRAGLYALCLLPVTIPLALIRWIGDLADDALGFLDRPAYRWREQRDEIWRKWIRSARLIRRERDQAAAPPASREVEA